MYFDLRKVCDVTYGALFTTKSACVISVHTKTDVCRCACVCVQRQVPLTQPVVQLNVFTLSYVDITLQCLLQACVLKGVEMW